MTKTRDQHNWIVSTAPGIGGGWGWGDHEGNSSCTGGQEGGRRFGLPYFRLEAQDLSLTEGTPNQPPSSK